MTRQLYVSTYILHKYNVVKKLKTSRRKTEIWKLLCRQFGACTKELWTRRTRRTCCPNDCLSPLAIIMVYLDNKCMSRYMYVLISNKYFSLQMKEIIKTRSPHFDSKAPRKSTRSKKKRAQFFSLIFLYLNFLSFETLFYIQSKFRLRHDLVFEVSFMSILYIQNWLRSIEI